MKQLFSAFYRKLEDVDMEIERYLKNQIEWNLRLIAITGARGTGKTTLLLQHIKELYGDNPENVLFVTLDNIYFSTNSLYALADEFYAHGGKELYLDEVHKYPVWAQEIKNIYDDFPKLKVSEIEFSMPKPSFTVDTLDKLKNEYPELCFTLIIGADNWNEFHLWKEYKRIREENEILIYPRLGEELIIETPFSNNVKSVDAPILQISSTFIRTSIRKDKDIRAFLPNKVHEYIETHKLYR